MSALQLLAVVAMVTTASGRAWTEDCCSKDSGDLFGGMSSDTAVHIANKLKRLLTMAIDKILEDSSFIYILSCAFTLLAVILAWRFTRSRQSRAKKHEDCGQSNVNEDELNAEEDGSPKVDAFIYAKNQKKKRKEKKKVDESDKVPEITDPNDINYVEDGGGPLSKIDPMTYAQHIPSEVKKVKQREMWKSVETEMTQEDKQNEREATREQLSAIFKLMETQKDQFGVEAVKDVEEQVKLYM